MLIERRQNKTPSGGNKANYEKGSDWSDQSEIAGFNISPLHQVRESLRDTAPIEHRINAKIQAGPHRILTDSWN